MLFLALDVRFDNENLLTKTAIAYEYTNIARRTSLMINFKSLHARSYNSYYAEHYLSVSSIQCDVRNFATSGASLLCGAPIPTS